MSTLRRKSQLDLKHLSVDITVWGGACTNLKITTKRLKNSLPPIGRELCLRFVFGNCVYGSKLCAWGTVSTVRGCHAPRVKIKTRSATSGTVSTVRVSERRSVSYT